MRQRKQSSEFYRNVDEDKENDGENEKNNEKEKEKEMLEGTTHPRSQLDMFSDEVELFSTGHMPVNIFFFFLMNAMISELYHTI